MTLRPSLLFLCSFILACAPVMNPAWPGVRAARYLHDHPETPSAIADAIQRGHVLVSMTREQVLNIAGEPRMRSRGKGGIEWWLYSAAPFHQGDSSHGATLAKISFIGDHVARIEFF